MHVCVDACVCACAFMCAYVCVFMHVQCFNTYLHDDYPCPRLWERVSEAHRQPQRWLCHILPHHAPFSVGVERCGVPEAGQGPQQRQHWTNREVWGQQAAAREERKEQQQVCVSSYGHSSADMLDRLVTWKKCTPFATYRSHIHVILHVFGMRDYIYRTGSE